MLRGTYFSGLCEHAFGLQKIIQPVASTYYFVPILSGYCPAVLRAKKAVAKYAIFLYRFSSMSSERFDATISVSVPAYEFADA